MNKRSPERKEEKEMLNYEDQYKLQMMANKTMMEEAAEYHKIQELKARLEVVRYYIEKKRIDERQAGIGYGFMALVAGIGYSLGKRAQ